MRQFLLKIFYMFIKFQSWLRERNQKIIDLINQYFIKTELELKCIP